VSPTVALLLLIAAAVLWATIPLLPAILELAKPTDVDPLVMVGRDNADLSRFARHFRAYAEANLRQLPPESREGDYFGKLPDGTHFVRVAALTEVLQSGALPDGSHDRVVIIDPPSSLKGGETFRLEVWARGRFSGGPEATYRALLADADAHLGPRSTVLRWAHARGTLTVEDGTTLFGRTSSETAIRLGRGVAFERAGAPVVAAGRGTATPPAAAPAVPTLQPLKLPDIAHRVGDHTRVDGDLTIPPRTFVAGNLVVAGHLQLGRGARVTGSVKAHGDVDTDEGAVIEGSLVSRGTIHLGAGNWVRGPVIAEETVTLGPGTGVGSESAPTTVSARAVGLDDGSGVRGHIVTQEGGYTAQ